MDVLRLPALGAFLKWRHARLTVQLVLLAAAILVVLHGLLGPSIAPRNAATVLTWVHYRGILILAIIAVGNLLCTGCPMVLVRDVARRVAPPTRRWPRWLRGKWIAIVLFIAVLFAYELFDLWELPRATAWLVIGYFALAVAVDTIFTGASFCKYVCPIGQFNFIASMLSPTELRVRDTATCRSCRTSDCIKGRYDVVQPLRLQQRGCELGLFLPMKVGNLDCTLCLDCVHACPHDNIGLVTRVPATELLETRRRSGIGRLAHRTDLAALALVFTFAALLNAAAMTAPFAALEARVAGTLGVRTEAPAFAVLFTLGVIVVPIALAIAATFITSVLAGTPQRSLVRAAAGYVFAMVPLGVAIWVAHYGFHLLTGAFTVVPVVQSAAIDFSGRALLGEPLWRWVGLQPGSVFPLQLGVVLLGATGAIGLVHAVSQRDYPAHPHRATVPWAVIVAVVAAASLWVFSLPMDMRGISLGG